jgi:hypothetical protein
MVEMNKGSEYKITGIPKTGIAKLSLGFHNLQYCKYF